ncbi:helix-turn-helix domain-containing protein [Conexibacter stalactiti]|uniref:Helix-turn-helix domain-containing protein n=1 Tax=Conexibacter stalactiti TaxID=1940611 RepID=A0ABU4HVR1_9ACTN|nr:helix-turn-helix domain-containing protein [Conexibacter stalactiti]MDW5597408.1 helix-turn-helix domain-containing protein [Conexibacter stalactiti]MEC5038050.1 helix-turn-helix domain-containing protein [Conexibacter stalactiti]
MSDAPAQQSEAPTLASLCSDLGGDLLTVALAPRGADVPIAEPVVHDPGEPLLANRGDVVLAIGLRAVEDGARELIAAAGAAGASAVVLKRRDGETVDPLLATAAAGGIALLTTPAAVAWGQLFALIRTSASARTPATQVSGAKIGDLFALADAVAAAAGGPVTIEDAQSRVLAFSNLDAPIDAAREATILGRRVPDEWMQRLGESGVFSRLRQAEGVTHVEFPGETAPRRAIAVRGGGALIGSIWIAEGELPLDERTDTLLEEAARIAALHLLRHRVSDDLDRRVHGEMLRSLLTGEAHADVVARELGLPDGAAFAVVAVRAMRDRQPIAHEPNAQLVYERIVNMIGVFFQSFRRRVSVATLDGRVYVLAIGERALDRDRFVQLTRDAIDNTAKALGVELQAGVGAPVQSLAEIPASRLQADQALRIGPLVAPTETVIDVEDHLGQVLLLEVGDFLRARPRRRSPPLARLHEHDRVHGTDYVATLAAYLDCFGNGALASERLHVHANTLRYRMRRIAEIAAIDLDDAGDRLPLELELRLAGGDR